MRFMDSEDIKVLMKPEPLVLGTISIRARLLI